MAHEQSICAIHHPPTFGGRLAFQPSTEVELDMLTWTIKPKTCARVLSLFAAGAMVLGSLASAQAIAQTANDAFGLWEHPENGSRIHLHPCGNGLCAKIVRVTDSQKTDDKNPDEALRKRPIIGLPIVVDARKSGEATWSGQLYNRIDGRTYAGQLTVKDRRSLAMTGCAVIIVCRTVVWHRVPAGSH